jgi:glycine/D-amino acid oxidase-like deaminating enzyme
VTPEFFPPPEPVPFVPDARSRLPDAAGPVVVGAGLLGASAAYHLAGAGLRPLVIEANAPASGASGRNAGMVLQALGGHFRRVNRLVREAAGRSVLDYTGRSLELLTEWDASLPGGIELDRSGSVDLFLTEAQAIDGRAAAAAQAAEGLEVELIDGGRLAELAPALDASDVLAAKWTPADGKLNPLRLVYALLGAAIERGAQLVTGVRVERLVERGGRLVALETSHGRLAADAVLLATNAWTPALVPAVASGLTPIREHVCVTEPLPSLIGPGFETNWCNEYWRQMRSGEVLIGGFTAADEAMGIGTYRMTVHPDLPPRLAALLRRLHPSLADARIVRCWSGVLDFASLEVPMVGPLPDASGATVEGGYLACGLTGHGMPWAPVLGLLAAELIVHGEGRTLPLAPFDPARYAARRHAPTWVEPFGLAVAR